eukprot:5706937-Amphidinium_carterae.1
MHETNQGRALLPQVMTTLRELHFAKQSHFGCMLKEFVRLTQDCSYTPALKAECSSKHTSEEVVKTTSNLGEHRLTLDVRGFPKCSRH